ncbi:MAG: hypothetical protein ACI9UK_000018 [Candidatus Krumholzibacteriia bacterium]|jgi:hypothetical protein
MSKHWQRMTKIGTAIVAVLLLAIQLVPVDFSNPPITSALRAPRAVAEILTSSCYDCHSNETRWPWYSKVAPMSWWIASHVEKGRGHLNFSEWPAYDFGSQDQFFQEIEEQLMENRMPLKSYVRGHPEARLSAEQKNILLEWARGS